MATLNAIRESLWGLGISEEALRGISTTSVTAFKAALKRIGVTDEQYNRANALADWRAGEGTTTRQALGNLLQTMGLPQDQIDRVIHGVVQNPDGTPRSYTDADLTNAVAGAFGAQVGTQVAIKLGKPAAVPAGAPAWNPFRADAPKAPAPTGPLAPGHRPLARPGISPATGAAPEAPGAPGRDITTGVTPTPGETARAVTAPAAAVDVTPALGAGATEDQVRNYVREHYGSYAYLYDVPELKEKVLRPAVEQGWDPGRIIGALEQTDWWKKTEPAARLWKEDKYRDPAETTDRINSKYATFKNLARAKGITIPEADLRELAEDALEFDWDDNETTAALGRFFRFDPNNLLGEAADEAVKIRQLHKAYLVPLSDTTVQTWTEKVMRGEATTNDFEDYLAIQAKALFPMFSKQIDLGVAPDVWVNPYREIAAQTLGIDAAGIDFRDPKWMRAIDEADPATGGRRPMYLNDWTNLLKTDDAYGWDKTDQGRKHGASLAAGLAETFGRSG